MGAMLRLTLKSLCGLTILVLSTISFGQESKVIPATTAAVPKDKQDYESLVKRLDDIANAASAAGIERLTSEIHAEWPKRDPELYGRLVLKVVHTLSKVKPRRPAGVHPEEEQLARAFKHSPRCRLS